MVAQVVTILSPAPTVPAKVKVSFLQSNCKFVPTLTLGNAASAVTDTEAEAEQAYLRIIELTRFLQQKSRLEIQNIQHDIQLKTQSFLNNQQRMLDFIAAEIPKNTKVYLNNQAHLIE